MLLELRDESWMPVRAACGCAVVEFAYRADEAGVLVSLCRCPVHRRAGGPTEERVMELALVGSLRAPVLLRYVGYRCVWCAGGCADCRPGAGSSTSGEEW